MDTKTRILIVEHDSNDIELIQYELKKGEINYLSEIVQNEEEYRIALKDFVPDIILSDYKLPAFHGLVAFEIKEKISPLTPLILVSGTIGEENSIELIKNGLTDFVLKDKLYSLPTKVERALKEAKANQQKNKAEEKLAFEYKEKEKQLAAVIIANSDLKKAEVKIIKANRLYYVISQINQLIVHTTDEQILFKEICNIVINLGKFRMAWIGMVDDKTKEVIAVAHAGEEHGYLSKIKTISANNSLTEGRGPTGTAFQEGKYSVCNDIKNNPKMSPWKTQALNHGYHSSIALPIKKSGKVTGVFNLYAGESDFFDDTEIALLEEITGDISFALENIEKDELRKKAEAALTENEFFLRESQKGGHIGSYKANFITGCWQSSETLDDIFGIDKNYIRSIEGWKGIVHPDDQNTMDEYLRLEVLGKQNSFDREYRIVKINDKQTRWVHGFGGIKLDCSGNVTALIGTIQDITERKITEQSLNDLSTRLLLATNSAGIGIFDWDIQKNILLWDSNMYQIFGVSPDKFSGAFEAWSNTVHPDDIDDGLAAVHALIDGTKEFHIFFRVFWPNKQIRYLEGHAIALRDGEGKAVRMIGVNRDITEQKESEQRAIKANRLYHFVSNINQIIVRITSEQVLFSETCNVATTIGKFKMAWIGLADESGKKLHLVANSGFAEGDLKRFSNLTYDVNGPIDKVMAGEAYCIVRDLQKEPGISWKKYAESQGINSVVVLAIKKAGKVIGALNLYAREIDYFDVEELRMLNEITDDISFALDNFEREKIQKETEALLTQNERRYRALIENGVDMITLKNPEGKLLYVSPSITTVLGYSTEELLRTPGYGLIHPDDLPGLLAQTQIILETPASCFSRQQRYLHKSGNWIWCEGTVSNMLDEPGINAIVSNFRDISDTVKAGEDLKQSEAQLAEAQRLSKMGSWNFDLRADKLTWSQELYKVFDIDKKEFKETFDSFLQLLDEENKKIVLQTNRHTQETGDPFNIKYQVTTQTNEKRIIEEYGYGVKDDNGDVIRLFGTAQDITERTKARENLLRSEARLKEAQAFSHVSNWEVDLLTGETSWSDEFYNIFGVNRNDIQPSEEAFVSFIYPDDRECAQKKIQHASETLESSSFNFRFLAEDGKIRFGYTEWKFELGKNNKPTRLYGILQDVTERKNAEEEIQKLATIVQRSPEFIGIAGLDARVIYLNDGGKNIVGLNRDINTTTMLDFIAPDDIELFQTMVIPTIQKKGRWTGDIHLRNFQTRHLIPVLMDMFYVLDPLTQKPIAYATVSADITERNRTEEALRLTQFVFDSAGDSIYWMTSDARIVNVNEAACNALGYTRQELMVLSVPDIDRDYNEDVWSDFFSELSEKGSLFFETVHQAKDGRLIPVEIRANYIKFGDKELSCAFVRDITERKKADENLKQSEIRFREFFENAPEALVVVDVATLQFINYNDNAIKLLKYPPEEIINIGLLDVSPEFQPDGLSSREKAKETTKSAIDGNKPVVDWLFNDVDGKEIICELRVVLLSSVDSLQLLVSFIDITERKDAGKKIEQQNKELALSNADLEQFAYVASHDLQEPLRMITSFLRLLEKKYQGQLDDTAGKYINFAVDGAGRMKTLIQALLTYSRVGSNNENFTIVDLNEVAQYATKVVEEDIKKNQSVITVAPLPVITGNYSLISQLLINLVTNAIKYHSDTRLKINIGSSEDKNNHTIFVKDNGIGIDPKFSEKIFILFQRLHSKDEYSGTGIGLAICKKIVEIHKGKIWVESEAGKGSTFYFSIPKQSKVHEKRSSNITR